jgi:hypothetical protein
VQLTRGLFPAAFYAGDAWGTFNSLMRLATGILFGIGTVWFGYPYAASSFGTNHPEGINSWPSRNFYQLPDIDQSDVWGD